MITRLYTIRKSASFAAKRKLSQDMLNGPFVILNAFLFSMLCAPYKKFIKPSL